MGQSKQGHIDLRQQEQDEKLNHISVEGKDNPNASGLIIKQQSFLDLTKSDIRDVAMQIVDNCLEGHQSSAEALVFAKKLTELAELVKENLADSAATELRLSKGEQRHLHNTVINEQMVGVKYDYSTANDPIWNDLKQRITERETLLKGIKGTLSVNIEDTGEVVELKEPVKTGKLALIIKVK